MEGRRQKAEECTEQAGTGYRGHPGHTAAARPAHSTEDTPQHSENVRFVFERNIRI
jgi:hypothetical protein